MTPKCLAMLRPFGILLAYGFRPFFLLAGLFGILGVGVWLAAYAGIISWQKTLTPVLWHGHEMLFGFSAAVLCGFLLTAVPNWTGTKAVHGPSLGLLVFFWFTGRMAFCLADLLPPAVLAAADLPLLPALILMIGEPIFAIRQKRNYFFPALLALLTGANILFHLENMGLTANTAQTGFYLAFYCLAMLVSLISGRIIPNFTVSAAKQRGEDALLKISMPLELAAFGAIAATAVTDLAMGGGLVSGALALVAALLLALRIRNWHTGKSLGDPLLWVLHMGGAWLALAFACLGLAELTGVITKSAAFHALTIGAVGVMGIGVMTRASLGHTGRSFDLARPVPLAYLLISLAAIIRVSASAAPASAYQALVIAAGLLWMTAFGIFIFVYWPILTKPRVDGKPG